MKKLVSGSLELGVRLTKRQLEMFELYYEELTIWSKKMNITSIKEYHAVELKHFLDSLTPASVFPVKYLDSCRIIDIGSGAGFPGLPLKIVFPDMDVTLVESNKRKSLFLRRVIKVLELSHVEVHNDRAEVLGLDEALRERFDVVFSRAVDRLPSVVELTLPFCRMGGVVVAFKKGDIEQELEESLNAIELLGGALKERRKVRVSGLGDNRVLVVMEKIRLTPSIYPRRPGIPRKRHL